MPKSDGSIVFSTSLDNSDLEKQIKAVEKRIESLKRKIENDTDKRTVIEKQMERSDEAIAKTEARILELKTEIEKLNAVQPGSAGYAQAQTAMTGQIKELAEQLKILEGQQKAKDKLNESWSKQNDLITVNTQKLEETKLRLNQLGAQSQAEAAKNQNVWTRASDSFKTKMSSAANSAYIAMTNAANRSLRPWEMVANKAAKTMRKVFVFSLVVAGIKAIKSMLTDVFQQSEQFNASVENLKAVINGFVAQLAQMVLPYLIMIVNTIAGVLERIAGLIDFIFGTDIAGQIAASRQSASNDIQARNNEKSVQYSQDMAAAQDKQAKAAKKLAKAQKEANRQLMAFDELNVLSEQESNEDDIADALADLENIEYPELPEYETDWTQSFIPDAGALSGLLSWLDELKNRIETDVEGPFAKIREGLNQIKLGFSQIAEGVRNGDWGLVWEGFTNVVVGSLRVIEGSIDAFLEWFDQATGYKFHDVITNMEEALNHFVNMVDALMHGDFQTAFSEYFLMMENIYGALKGTVNHIFAFLDDITGGKLHNELTHIAGFVNGFLDLNLGIVTGDIERCLLGIHEMITNFFALNTDIFTNAVLALQTIVRNLFSSILEGVAEFFNNLRAQHPELDVIISAVEQAVLGGIGTIEGVLDGLLEFISVFGKGLLEGLSQIANGIVDRVVGIFTFDDELIAQGLKGIVNGIFTVFEGAINGLIQGAVTGLNDIIGAVNMVPGVDIGYASFDYITIQRLANGAVIPPNREFMAVLGDQTSGNNIEAPESLLRQIVREEGGADAQVIALLQSMLNALQQRQTIECDGYTLAKTVNRYNAINQSLYGV